MTTSIVLCLAAFAGLIVMLRTDRLSLGLPVAYLFSLLLIHVPGAIAHLVGGDLLRESEYTELGIWFTAIGAVAFLAGTWLARQHALPVWMPRPANRSDFWLFCLVAGWIVTYGFGLLRDVPSVAAAVEKGGAAWMLGVLLGLRSAVARRDTKWIVFWLACLAVYPALRLLIGGFLSYGTTSIIIVLSVLSISVRGPVKVLAGVVVTAVLALNLFLSYFQNRNDIRGAVWGGAPLEQRVDVSLDIFRDFEWFDPRNERHLIALDMRLNQNYFAGLAATRINERQVDYLGGRSLWEGAMALVPRAVWPDKPVFGGSPKIVADMTGLVLAENTSWGVGNVMEFQINFGIPGLVIGFFALGWGLGLLDRRAAFAEASGDLGGVFLYFLPGVALVAPNSSVVELVGGAAAAWVAAVGWRWVWVRWSHQPEHTIDEAEGYAEPPA
jgi:hypothetical protein